MRVIPFFSGDSLHWFGADTSTALTRLATGLDSKLDCNRLKPRFQDNLRSRNVQAKLSASNNTAFVTNNSFVIDQYFADVRITFFVELHAPVYQHFCKHFIYCGCRKACCWQILLGICIHRKNNRITCKALLLTICNTKKLWNHPWLGAFLSPFDE